MEVETLIEAVRKRQVLYDKIHEDYSNRNLINQLWNDVAKEVGIDGATARKKWAVLRDSFRRHYKKETTYKSRSGGKRKKTWYLYKSMLFLLPFVEDLNSSTSSNVLERLKTDEESQQTSQLLEDSLDTVSDVDIAPQGAADMQASPSPSLDPQPGLSSSALYTTRPNKNSARKRPYPAYPQRRATQSASRFDVAMLDALKSLQQQQQQQQQHRAKDDDELFLMSLLPVMKSLDLVTKFEFRGELNNTALKYLKLSQQPRHTNMESTSTGTACASNVNPHQ